MPVQTVTTILTDPGSAEAQVHKATALARACDAHLQVCALAITWDQPAIVQTAIEAAPVAAALEDGRVVARDLAEKAMNVLKGEDLRWDVTPIAVIRANLAEWLRRHTRFSDLVVLHRRADGAATEQHIHLAETLLFEVDVPLVILPEEGEFHVPASSVMVAWDESAPALRAARSALSLLEQAGTAYVALVDPARDAPDRSDPGGAFAQFLARHGVRNEVSVLNRTDDTIA
jgi:hypothetical protein